MTSNRFLLQVGDYDLKYEFRIADLTRVDKTIEDFWNEKAEVYEYLEYLNYLYMNGAFLTMEEANKIFNGLHKENKELQHKLLQQKMEYATDLHRLAEENRELEQRVSFYKDFQKDARELANENEKLKQLLLQFYTEDEINAEMI